MNKSPLRIGNAQGFWGDSSLASAQLIQQQPNLDYLTLDYLAEVSLSIMAIQREKNPEAGFAKDFVDTLRSLIPFWKQGSHLKVVTNAGGLNPMGCALACKKVLEDAGCKSLRIGIVSGDDVFHTLKSSASPLFANMETKDPISTISPALVTANAYFGAQPIVEVLLKGADIVITGRTADPSLTVGPCAAHFGWQWDDYNRLAGATIAGHLIECGTQVSGGMSTNWLEIPDLLNIGFPFVEMQEDSSFIITKPEGTGGKVSLETVKEQLLYEIGDPKNYLSPDATVSFLGLQLEQEGPNRIRIKGAIGSPPPPTFKVSATYRDGYKTEGMIVVFGPEASRKARLCGELILARIRKAGFPIPHANVECIGDNAIAPGIIANPHTKECVLRITIADPNPAALECFSKELASLVTCGPQGVTGYSSGRPHVRPVFGYWPCLIERDKAIPSVRILEVN